MDHHIIDRQPYYRQFDERIRIWRQQPFSSCKRLFNGNIYKQQNLIKSTSQKIDHIYIEVVIHHTPLNFIKIMLMLSVFSGLYRVWPAVWTMNPSWWHLTSRRPYWRSFVIWWLSAADIWLLHVMHLQNSVRLYIFVSYLTLWRTDTYFWWFFLCHFTNDSLKKHYIETCH